MSVCVGQQVTLSLDESAHILRCVVASLDGAVATLVNTTQTGEELDGRLAGGATGFLVLTDAEPPVGVRGAAILTPKSRPLIEFLITDQA